MTRNAAIDSRCRLGPRLRSQTVGEIPSRDEFALNSKLIFAEAAMFELLVLRFYKHATALSNSLSFWSEEEHGTIEVFIGRLVNSISAEFCNRVTFS